MSVSSSGGSGEESATRPCPQCGKQLRLTANLHGRRVRCKACGTALLVSAEPWGLSVVEGAAAGEQPGVSAGAGQAAPPAAPAPPKAPPAAPAPPPAVPAAAAGAGPPPVPPEGGPPPLEPGVADASGTAYAARPRAAIRAKPLIIVGVAVLAVVFAGLLIAMLLPGGGASKALRYLPDNCDGVVSVNVSDLLGSKLYRKIEEDNPQLKQVQEEMLRETGLKLSDISRATIGLKLSNPEEPVGVIEFSKSVDAKSLLDSGGVKWREQKHGDLTIYEGGSASESVCFVDNRTAILGPAGQLRSVLDRKRKAELSEGLQSQVSGLDFSKTVAAAFVVPSDLAGIGGLPVGVPLPTEMLGAVEAVTLHVDVGSDVRFSAAVICKDDETAEGIEKSADAMLTLAEQQPNVPAEAKELLDSIDISRSGRTVRGRVTIKEEMLNKAIEEAKGGVLPL